MNCLGIRQKEEFTVDNYFPDTSRICTSYYNAFDLNSGVAWVNEVLQKFNRIDVLINNAAILEPCGIENYNEESFDRMWLINTKAPISLTKEAWKYLKQSGQGRVINIVSIAGKSTRPDDFGYNLSKHALLAFTHSIRQAGWNSGIRATAICPGWVNTSMATNSRVCDLSTSEMTQPEDIAQLVKTAIKMPNTASLAEIVVNAECDQFF